MGSTAEEDLGLETAWVDDQPATIAATVAYLEQHNFLVYVTASYDDVKARIGNNGRYAVLLTDLKLLNEGERDGIQLIEEIRGAGAKVQIVPVTKFLDEYEDELPDDLKKVAIDKEEIDHPGGNEKLRRLLIELGGPGDIRVRERVVGFVEEKLEDCMVVKVRLPDNTAEQRILPICDPAEVIPGPPQFFFQIVTLERRQAGDVRLETFFTWLPDLRPEKGFPEGRKGQ